MGKGRALKAGQRPDHEAAGTEAGRHHPLRIDRIVGREILNDGNRIGVVVRLGARISLMGPATVQTVCRDKDVPGIRPTLNQGAIADAGQAGTSKAVILDHHRHGSTIIDVGRQRDIVLSFRLALDR